MSFPTCAGDRSAFTLSDIITRKIEGDSDSRTQGARQKLQAFINARSSKEIVFTANTSHAINIVALGFPYSPGDRVLITDREHNSNLLPWLRLQQKGLIEVVRINTDNNGAFDMHEFKHQLENGRIRLVSMGYTSNLTGDSIPAEQVVRLAHQYGAWVMLDAAQAAPHRAIDVQALDVDFLAFSLHKMCGPIGVGVLYIKNAELETEVEEHVRPGVLLESALLGGGTVSDATYASYSLLDQPERFEVGVQNDPGQIAAGTAVDYLLRIGMDAIYDHECRLNRYLTGHLLQRYGRTGWFRILGPQEEDRRGGILTVEIRRPNAVGIARELSASANIMIRSGAFCVHSYLNHLFGSNWARPGLPADHRMTYRVSLYFYNTEEECRVFLETLDDILRQRCYID